MCGFPGETEEEFKETYELLNEIKLYKIHVFPYSIRKGTIAASFKDQLDSNIKEERSKKIINLSNKMQNEYNRQYIGKSIKVLVEEKDSGFFKGHSDNYIYVKIKSEDEEIKNKIVNVIIDENQDDILIGKIEHIL